MKANVPKIDDFFKDDHQQTCPTQISCINCVDGKNENCSGCLRYRLVTAAERLSLKAEKGFVNRLESVLEGMVKIGAEGSSRLQEQE